MSGTTHYEYNNRYCLRAAIDDHAFWLRIGRHYEHCSARGDEGC